MKLNNDCVRDLLLYIEENSDLLDYIDMNQIKINSWTSEDIIYTSLKLKEAGYINAKIDQTFDGYYGIIKSLTWSGHKFLDNIRDDNVWKTTKGIISKFSSVSLGIVEKIASQVITNLINQHMGQPY